MKWWCGRCQHDVVKKKCNCIRFPSPWWYVPTTLLERLRCRLSTCSYKIICVKCTDREEYYKKNKRID